MQDLDGQRVVVLANGSLDEPEYARALLQPDDFVIAANGGSRLAWQLGVGPHLLVGDSDSLPDDVRRWLMDQAVPQLAYPRDKDATDLELAVQYAIERGARAMLLLGLAGGRVDHTVANLSLLVTLLRSQVEAEAVSGFEHIRLIEDFAELQGQAGQTVSLLPWSGAALGVETVGMRWELHGETLPFGAARGISNVMLRDRATVRLSGGLLLVCHHQGRVR